MPDRKLDKSYRDGYLDGWMDASQAWKRLCKRMHWSTALYVLRAYWCEKLRPWADKTTDEAEFPPELNSYAKP